MNQNDALTHRIARGQTQNDRGEPYGLQNYMVANRKRVGYRKGWVIMSLICEPIGNRPGLFLQIG